MIFSPSASYIQESVGGADPALLSRAQKMLKSMKGLLAREKSMSLNHDSSSHSPSHSKFLSGRRKSGSWRPSDGSASGVGVEISRDQKMMMSRPQNLQLLSQ